MASFGVLSENGARLGLAHARDLVVWVVRVEGLDSIAFYSPKIEFYRIFLAYGYSPVLADRVIL